MDNITNYACDYGPEEAEYKTKLAKLDAEKTKLYMESMDLKIALDNITYRKKIVSIVFITGMVISAIVFGIFVVAWLYSFSMYDIYGEWLNYITQIAMVIFAVVFIIMAIPYFCMMSQEYFWIKCANLLKRLKCNENHISGK